MKYCNVVGAPSMYEFVGDIRTGRGASSDPLTSSDREPKELLSGREGSPDNYRLSFSESGKVDSNAWTTPRHHHVFEQIRYPLVGDYSIAQDVVLPAGCVAYFPESAYYGPQRMNPNLRMVVLQYGGPSGMGYMSAQQRRRGFDELLAKGGKFEKGMYTWTDSTGERHNQDAHEALWEQVIGTDCTYPTPRDDGLIMMNPTNFAWKKDEAHSGVARKLLGSFTERDIRIGFIQLDTGAKVPFGTEEAAEILFLTEGAVSSRDGAHGPLTGFSSESDEEPEVLQATEPTELFYIKLPTF